MDSIFAKAVLRSADATRHRRDEISCFKESMAKLREATLCVREVSEEVAAATCASESNKRPLSMVISVSACCSFRRSVMISS